MFFRPRPFFPFALIGFLILGLLIGGGFFFKFLFMMLFFGFIFKMVGWRHHNRDHWRYSSMKSGCWNHRHGGKQKHDNGIDELYPNANKEYI